MTEEQTLTFFPYRCSHVSHASHVSRTFFPYRRSHVSHVSHLLSLQTFSRFTRLSHLLSLQTFSRFSRPSHLLSLQTFSRFSRLSPSFLTDVLTFLTSRTFFPYRRSHVSHVSLTFFPYRRSHVSHVSHLLSLQTFLTSLAPSFLTSASHFLKHFTPLSFGEGQGGEAYSSFIGTRLATVRIS